MVEVMLGLFGLAGDFSEFGDVRKGNYQILPAGFKIEPENT